MMNSEAILNWMNNFFPLPAHPFNLSNEGKMSYSEWQFEKGRQTLEYFYEFADDNEMFVNKTALDIGCGAGGKTLFYASLGARKVYGVDVIEKYISDARRFAENRKAENVEFAIADARKLPLPDESIDTIIANDVIEHLRYPEEVLKECHRVLKPKGRIYISFPPYNHPYGAHLSDAIGIPWVHLLFGEQTMINVYKRRVSCLADGNERINLRISKNDDGKEYFSYINKMTLKRYLNILASTQFNVVNNKIVPLRGIPQICARIPFIAEFVSRMVVTILEK